MNKERAKRHFIDLDKVVESVFALCLLSFTEKQKKALNERDTKYGVEIKGNKGSCQFPFPHKCNGDQGTHLHHILPQRYALTYGVNPDFATNGIRICKGVHIENSDKDIVIHPDTREAKKAYNAGNKKAYDEMMEDRKAKIEEKTPYWNYHYDRPMQVVALKNTQKASIFGWFFPSKRERNGHNKNGQTKTAEEIKKQESNGQKPNGKKK